MPTIKINPNAPLDKQELNSIDSQINQSFGSSVTEQLKDILSNPSIRQAEELMNNPAIKQAMEDAKLSDKIQKEFEESERRSLETTQQSLWIQTENNLRKQKANQAILNMADHVEQFEAQYRADMKQLKEERRIDKEEAAKESRKTRRQATFANIVAFLSLFATIVFGILALIGSS